MSLIHWQPWQEVETLSRQIDRLFTDLATVSCDSTLVTNTWSPAIELEATDAAFVLRAQLPGIDAQDLDIQVTREAVSIAGDYRLETKHEDGKFFRSEFRYGSFRRVVPLPVAIQNDQVKADFTNGILTLTLPKLVNDRPKVVKVNLADETAKPKLEVDCASAAIATAQTTAQSDDVWAEQAA